ncbi:MAG TPA: SlyX family protein [Pseudomonadales bacterium]
MSDELIELQTQLAFQEHTIAELNDVLTSQQKQIDLLRLEIKLLKEKLGILEDRIDTGPQQNEKPPHY